MNVIKQLKKDKINLDLNYYGIDDLATNNDISLIINKETDLLNKLKTINTSSEINLDNYINYLLVNKLVKFKELEYMIKEPYKEELYNIINLSEEKLNEFNKNKGKIIKFINSKYKDIFENRIEYRGIVDNTIEIIKTFQRGIKSEVFMYIINSYNYIMIDNYSSFQKIIEEEPLLFKSLFSVENIKHIMEYRFETLIEIFINIKMRNTSLYESIPINDLLDFMEEIIINTDENKIMINHNFIKQSYVLTDRLKLKEANKFKNYYEKAEKLLDNYLLEKGQVLELELPYRNIVDIYIKNNSEPMYKNLSLTHSYDNKRNLWKSFLDNNFTEENSLADLIGSNIDTDYFFTFTHQSTFDLMINTVGVGIYAILKEDELYKMFIMGYEKIFAYIGKFESSFNDLIIDFKEITEEIIKIGNQEDKNSIQYYGVSMFMCAFIEQIIKKIYISISKEVEYIDFRKLTLGSLLRSNKLIDKVFTDNAIKNLSFFLIEYETNDERKIKIGKNYRNDLAHLSNDLYKNIDLIDIMNIYYILLNVLNSIFIYFVKWEKEILTYQKRYHR